MMVPTRMSTLRESSKAMRGAGAAVSSIALLFCPLQVSGVAFLGRKLGEAVRQLATDPQSLKLGYGNPASELCPGGEGGGVGRLRNTERRNAGPSVAS